MKAFKIISVIILFSMLFACNHTDRKIINYIQSVCTKDCDTCYIDLRQVLKVDYDSMFLFCEFTQPDEISFAMGIPYSSNCVISDSEWRIILLKDNQIVYEGDIPTQSMRFEEITGRVDTIPQNANYLVHYSPYYLVNIRGENNSGNDYYCLEEISEKPQYRRTDYKYGKGYTFEEVIKSW